MINVHFVNYKQKQCYTCRNEIK